MSEYNIPTDGNIRSAYDAMCQLASAVGDFPSTLTGGFDRWLAAHDREVAEKAWDEGFMRANRLVNCRMCRGTTVPKINPYTV